MSLLVQPLNLGLLGGIIIERALTGAFPPQNSKGNGWSKGTWTGSEALNGCTSRSTALS